MSLKRYNPSAVILPLKISISDHHNELVKLVTKQGNYTIMLFSEFEKVAKQFYAAYKKYKYVFEKGKK